MRTSLLVVLLLLSNLVHASRDCKGTFVNPVNICWKCLFPLSIGNSAIVKGSGLKDTENPKSPVGICGLRAGLNIGFWEPFAMVDVTDKPYCLVNLGGHRLNLGKKQGQGGRVSLKPGSTHAFYHVHWYRYPLIAWLNLLTDAGCHEGGDFDVAYMSELDPFWNDSEASLVLNPEAILFSNPKAQASCAADSLSTALTKWPLDKLYWCAGGHGSMYPLNGHIASVSSPVQASLLLAERMNFKLHRQLLITDSIPVNGRVCEPGRYPVLPKSRYRYEMVNQVMDGKNCYPSGYPASLS